MCHVCMEIRWKKINRKVQAHSRDSTIEGIILRIYNGIPEQLLCQVEPLLKDGAIIDLDGGELTMFVKKPVPVSMPASLVRSHSLGGFHIEGLMRGQMM